jgi:ABC-2 type transport system permease protein
MKKILLIGWKDLVLAFRDRAALILMLVAPFALTLGLGLVTGRFSSNANSGLSDIPVILVNQDSGQLGNELVKVLLSPDLGTLIKPVQMDDPVQARQKVDSDQAAAVVIIPAGFTQSILPAQGVVPGATSATSRVIPIELYTNPTRPTSASIVKTIVDEYLNQVEISQTGGNVAVSQLIKNGLIQVQDAAQVGRQISEQQAAADSSTPAITLQIVMTGGKAVEFDILSLFAPGMAMMFLMFTVSNGGRTLLAERTQGTLPRLIVSPTSALQIFGGKVFGIYLTGVAQMLILILASTALFRLNWGDPGGVAVLVLAAVTGATGWGMLITSLAKTPGQISAIGSALMLIFGILGGSFINLENMPGWFTVVSKITPNSWGLDGFLTLASGGHLVDILGAVTALLVMGILLFSMAVIIINRRGIIQS